jgi:ABC-type branched-subunit amino acid transport system ATPase component
MGLCSEIAVINFGTLLALGNPETIRNDKNVIKAYLGKDT